MVYRKRFPKPIRGVYMVALKKKGLDTFTGKLEHNCKVYWDVVAPIRSSSLYTITDDQSANFPAPNLKLLLT